MCGKGSRRIRVCLPYDLHAEHRRRKALGVEIGMKARPVCLQCRNHGRVSVAFGIENRDGATEHLRVKGFLQGLVSDEMAAE